MPAQSPPIRVWRLNTKAQEDGSAPEECVTVQNVRVDRGGVRKRPAMAHVLEATGNRKSADFVAASSMMSEAPADPRVWVLGTKFTVKCLWFPDLTDSTRTFFFAGTTTPAMVLDISSANFRWRVWDSAGTLTTVTVGAATAALHSIMLVRDGAALTSRLNNVAGGTGSISATLSLRPPVGVLRFARDDSTNYFDGKLGHLRVRTTVETDHNDRLLISGDPRSADVVADYVWTNASPTTPYDRSRFGNHGASTNSPTAAAPLEHNPASIRGLVAYKDRTRKRLLVLAGETPYVVPVA